MLNEKALHRWYPKCFDGKITILEVTDVEIIGVLDGDPVVVQSRCEARGRLVFLNRFPTLTFTGTLGHGFTDIDGDAQFILIGFRQ